MNLPATQRMDKRHTQANEEVAAGTNIAAVVSHTGTNVCHVSLCKFLNKDGAALKYSFRVRNRNADSSGNGGSCGCSYRKII